MTCPRFAVVLLALLVGLAWTARPAVAQQQPSLPSHRHANAVQALQSVQRHTLPDVNTDALQEEDAERADRIGPYRYGTVVETDLSPRGDGTWERLPGGHWLWRLRIQSREALSLSLTFTRFQLPEGATLSVYGSDKSVVRGPYTHDDATSGQHSTPIVRGDELIVELYVPRGRRSDTDLTIGKVTHGYRPLFSRSDRRKSGACNIDVACEEADPWQDQVSAVARYSFEAGGDRFLCTGSLVNNTEEDNTPYFLTAEHCISSAEQASSMVFYWNYENSTCRTPGSNESGTVTDDDPSDQTSSGAILRARYGSTHEDGDIAGKPDLALVEIDDTIPYTYDLFFSGWSREGQSTQESVTIHHPQGHGKRISFDQDPSDITGYGLSGGGDTHLRIGNWELGTTEVGSSGSPLFDTNQRIVGVLSGGGAGCDGDGDVGDNNKPDWYGRAAPGFDNGDYQSSTLSDWLDPTNSGKQTLDGIPQVDVDDDTPPAKIEDLTVSSVDTTSMTLEWTASGDDDDQGTALEYDLRYATSSIDSDDDFASATEVVDLPDPKVAGTTQQTEVTGLIPDSTYHFAIRAIDDGQNESKTGTSEPTLLPDKIAPAPIKNLRITNVNTTDLEVTVKWTATGDDQRRGRASSYDLRYADSPIETKTDFQNATRVTGLPQPAKSSNTETVRLTEADGLEQGDPYHFALVAIDNAGNTSPQATPKEKAVLVKDISVSKGTAASNQTIQFVVKETQTVRVELYDLLGRQLGVIFDSEVQEGLERVAQIDATRRQLSSGPYFLRFVGETFTKTRKIMVVK
jgi:lysyl endopeptidase